MYSITLQSQYRGSEGLAAQSGCAPTAPKGVTAVKIEKFRDIKNFTAAASPMTGIGEFPLHTTPHS